MFCFPAVGAKRPKLSQVYLAFLPLLYGPALRSPFCFHRRATSCGTSCTFLPLFDPAPFLFMHRREHSQLQCIKFSMCMQITSSRIFLRLLTPPACYFPVNSPSFLPSFLSQRQYLLPAEFQPTRYLAVDRKRKTLAANLNYFVNKPGNGNCPLEPSHCKLNTS